MLIFTQKQGSLIIKDEKPGSHRHEILRFHGLFGGFTIRATVELLIQRV